MLPANNRHYTAVFQHPDSNPPIRVEGNFILLEFIIVSMWFGNVARDILYRLLALLDTCTVNMPSPLLTSAAAMPLIDAYWPFPNILHAAEPISASPRNGSPPCALKYPPSTPLDTWYTR